MRGEEVEKRAGQRITEEHVADFLGMAVADPRALGQTADLFQRAGDSAGVARELDRRGVGQELALAADRAFDQVAEEHTDVAEDQHDQAKQKDTGRAARLLRVARGSGARETHGIEADHR